MPGVQPGCRCQEKRFRQLVCVLPRQVAAEWRQRGRRRLLPPQRHPAPVTARRSTPPHALGIHEPVVIHTGDDEADLIDMRLQQQQGCAVQAASPDAHDTAERVYPHILYILLQHGGRRLRGPSEAGSAGSPAQPLEASPQFHILLPFPYPSGLIGEDRSAFHKCRHEALEMIAPFLKVLVHVETRAGRREENDLPRVRPDGRAVRTASSISLTR